MSQSATILLVEDDNSMREGIRELLEISDLGYELNVQTAPNGREGITSAHKHSPDLIISDIMMPHMDGFQMLEAIRNDSETLHIPFIFLSAKGRHSDVMQGNLSGAEMYITKPFDPTEMIDLVKAQLQRSMALNELRETKVVELKQSLLQLVNHEFRTPLTYVTAYYEMLADAVDNYDDQSELQEYLRGIHAGCIRMSSLVLNLVNVIELRSGSSRRDYQKNASLVSDLGLIIQEAITHMEPIAREQNIKLKSDIADNLPEVWGHRPFILDAVRRVIDNAIKFTSYKHDASSAVTVTASSVAGADGILALIAINDNGIGIPASAHEDIFEPFYQHDRPILEQQGSGSGLTIAKGYMDFHNGKISVESSPKVGSTFTIALPQFRGTVPEMHELGSEHRYANILAVEDDPFLLEGLQELLELCGSKYEFRVKTADSGKTGLAVLENFMPDLIISDIMMPIMDGYEFLDNVRKSEDWMHVPFVFVTAKSDRSDIHKGRMLGVEDYITKPYDSDELLQRINAKLDRYFQVQEALDDNFEDMKQGILQLISPEIIQPLQVVQNYSETLSENLAEAKSEDDLRDLLLGIEANSSDLSTLVGDFITLVEFQTGEAQAAYKLRGRPYEIGALINQLAFEYKNLTEEKGFKLALKMSEQLPMVKCDVRPLNDAFNRIFNLTLMLGEAESSKSYALASSASGNNVLIRIATYGKPFSTNDAKTITDIINDSEDQYSNIPYAASLKIAQRTIELHGGSLKLEKGTLFTISLPVVPIEELLD